jgi:hypothetical protein
MMVDSLNSAFRKVELKTRRAAGTGQIARAGGNLSLRMHRKNEELTLCRNAGLAGRLPVNSHGGLFPSDRHFL